MTAPADKPASLRDIIAQACTDAIAAVVPTGDYPLDTAILDRAIAAITALVPDKVAPDNINPQPLEKYEKGYNFAIDEIHRNLKGEA